MNSNTYIAIYPPTAKYAWGEVVDPIYDENNISLCPMCKGFLSGMNWIGEKTLEIRGRKNIPDFLYAYGINNPFVVSEKALTVLKENDIKGITDTEKIDRIIVKKEITNQTFYMMTLERCIFPIDYTQSKIVFGKNFHPERKCKLCNPVGRTKDFILGLYFDRKTDVDMDIFHTYEMGDTVFLSEQFVKVCQANNLTGLFYENVTEYNTAKGIFSEQEITKMSTDLKNLENIGRTQGTVSENTGDGSMC